MKRAVFVVLGSCFVLSACAQPATRYYWGDYSESLYRAKKAPGDESLAEHRRMLVHIIEESNRQSLRVPPGVYGEYGYILIQQGNGAEGLKYLDLEVQTYPESRVFIERVKEQANRPAGDRRSQP